MESFTLALSNSAILTGIKNIPPPSPSAPKYRPLIVALHGGGYRAQYFDINASHSAAPISTALSAPFVAINRPGYVDSTPYPPIAPDSSYPETYGLWLHRYILPCLWKTFGLPLGCNSIVLVCHSLGTPGAVICAAYHGEEKEPEYPLGGLVFSGFGISLIPGAGHKFEEPYPDEVNFPIEMKNQMYLSREACDSAVYTHQERLHTPIPFRELADIHTVWIPRVREEWGCKVRVPVMFAVVEGDCYFQGTEGHVQEMKEMFLKGSRRVEGGVIRGPPHNLEMSYWAGGWYATSFGWALECAAELGVVEGGERED